jgi:hypothetical protein
MREERNSLVGRDPPFRQRWRGNTMRDFNEGVEPHRPITVETEAEEDNVFILEELITKLTARDPLKNRLAGQLNEYIGSVQKQLMMEETAPEEEYEKAYTKLQETETKFSKVMRAEVYYEQKLLQCSQPHERDEHSGTNQRSRGTRCPREPGNRDRDGRRLLNAKRTTEPNSENNKKKNSIRYGAEKEQIKLEQKKKDAKGA